MKFTRDIILKPIVSEKSHALSEGSKYTFSVAPGAKKQEIKSAIEEIFNVNVVKVNTMNVKGKPKRLGRRQLSQGYTSSWKKAIVTLEKGQNIEIFGGI